MSLAERFRDRLPLGPDTPVVSLGEGSTPLLRAPRLSERYGLDVRLKWEGANPTGSFKDRGMTIAISKALEEGARAVVCASTGNTAASAAAYAARAGLEAVIVQPAGAVAGGKLAQALAHGAELREVEGSFDAALDEARALADGGSHSLVNSLNPYRLEGQKTVVFELLEELGRLPDAVALPYGGGGNTRAVALGFEEAGAGLPPLYAGESSQRATTFASAPRAPPCAAAIRLATPAHGEHAEAAVRRSEGGIVSLSEEEIEAARRALAQEEGVFCEPASAAGVAALAHADLPRGALVVCIVTGHGLKDPDAAARLARR